MVPDVGFGSALPAGAGQSHMAGRPHANPVPVEGLCTGHENALVLVDSATLYEVRTFVSLTNHAWDAFVMLPNGRAWNRLGAKMQDVVAKNLDQAALAMREDAMKLDETLETQLEAKGMTFNRAPADPFRQTLREAGVCSERRETFGAEAWAVLEKSVG